ncbi:MAG: MXAN_5187 C-terminal domain-containing protein [Myxococcaceae bacterium]
MSEPLDPAGRKMVGNADVLKECDALEGEIASLKASYDQYFLGLDRRPPTDKYSELKRRVAQLKGYYIRSTALKFRAQSLAQKFATWERLWLRTLQEIENGTYRRHLAKARRRSEAAGGEAGKPAAAERKQTDDFSIDEVSPEEAEELLSGAAFAKPPAPPTMTPVVPPVAPPTKAAQRIAPAAPPRPAGSQGGAAPLSDEKLRAVYDAFVKAKKRCNEDVSKLSYDQVAQSLRKQVPDLMTKHNAKAVEFKVVIKDGKAMLRAVPKEG